MTGREARADHVPSATNALCHETIRRVPHLPSDDQTRHEPMDIDLPSSSFKENVPLARKKCVASAWEVGFRLSAATQDDDGRPNFRARSKKKEARPLWLTTTEPAVVCGCTREAEGGCWGGCSYVLLMKPLEISLTVLCRCRGRFRQLGSPTATHS